MSLRFTKLHADPVQPGHPAQGPFPFSGLSDGFESGAMSHCGSWEKAVRFAGLGPFPTTERGRAGRPSAGRVRPAQNGLFQEVFRLRNAHFAAFRTLLTPYSETTGRLRAGGRSSRSSFFGPFPSAPQVSLPNGMYGPVGLPTAPPGQYYKLCGPEKARSRRFFSTCFQEVGSPERKMASPFCILSLVLFFGSAAPESAPKSPAERLARALKAGDRSALRALLKEDPVSGKRWFARKLEDLLRIRERGGSAPGLQRRLKLLADVFSEELGEVYLKRFLDQALRWDGASISLKFEADRQAQEAVSLLRRRETDRCKALLRRSLRVYRDLGHTKGITACLLLLGQAASMEGKRREAEKVYRRALSEAESAAYRTHVLKALSCLGSLYRGRGNYREAEACYKRYLEVARAGRDQAAVSRALANLGHVAAEVGRFEEAVSYFQKALSLPGRDRSIESSVLYGLGRAYHDRRDYLHASRSYAAALRKARRPRLRAAVLDSFGLLWVAQGDPRRAASAFEEALEIERKWRLTGCIAATTTNLAQVHAAQGRYQEAAKLLGEALEKARMAGNRPLEARICANRGILEAQRGRYEQAEKWLRAGAARLKELGDLKGLAEVTIHLAGLQLRRGNLKEAETLFDSAFKLQKDIRDYGGMARALLGRAKAAAGRGRTRTAEDLLSRAMDLTERQRGLVSSSYFRNIFLSAFSLGECYTLAIHLLVGEGKVAQALRTAERAKARGLLADLIERGALEKIPRELRQEELRFRSEAVRLRRRLLKARGAQREALTEAFDRNEAAYERVLEEIWASAGRDVLPPVAETAELLKFASSEADIVLQYALGPEQSYLFVISKGSVSAVPLPEEKRIQALADRFRSELRTPAGEAALQTSKEAEKS